MPLYIPWLTETIKKRGVRYLLHHYLGQFFEEKLTLEQLSIDIYEGKGSIRNLALDVNGLNDELDFVPFKFLDGCLIGHISVEVPWSTLATDACKVELDGAVFICRLKTSADGSKQHCTESTLLTKSLMTSSMQMAEDIVATEDDDDIDSMNSSVYHNPSQQNNHHQQDTVRSDKKDASKMFEGLEMFAQLIDSVLRRTKLTARNTLFQIKPQNPRGNSNRDDDEEDDDSSSDEKLSSPASSSSVNDGYRSAYGEEFSEARANAGEPKPANDTVEFFIKYFRCEEVIEEPRGENVDTRTGSNEEQFKKPLSAIPETITKQLTLEDVEMRIGGVPVSNLIGKHTIVIKFNGHKSEISIFSGSPLLAVIGHEQLKTFFNVFDGNNEKESETIPVNERDQQVMSPEDYAKIENQLLETAASLRHSNHHPNEFGGYVGGSSSHHRLGSGSQGGRRWVDSGDVYSNMSRRIEADFDYHSTNSSSTATCPDGKLTESEPTLDNIEAFSCELKLPGIWLCILKDGETLPPLIKPYADSINSFQTINRYIEARIKVPHIRFLALKVALDITNAGINVFFGDLDISEHLQNDSMSPTLNLFQNDSTNQPMSSARYKASIVNGKDITIDFLATTRVIFDPTMIDRICYDYKLLNLSENGGEPSTINEKKPGKPRGGHSDLNLTIKGEQFKVELLCPIPDLTPEADLKTTQLRPQSFLFDFKNIVVTWQSDKLNASALEMIASVKSQPKQSDAEAVKFIESTGKNNDRIVLTLEPSPSSLDNVFPSDIDRVLNESSMYDSIYVGQATESKIPAEAFQTKRKVVRGRQEDRSKQRDTAGSKSNDCDNERIIAPGDRQHLMDYLDQTVSSTKLSLSLHLPVCEVEFEDKEQLDLIYNRFGNDFVFWQPKALAKDNKELSELTPDDQQVKFRRPIDDSGSDVHSEHESEQSHDMSSANDSSSERYSNQTTCKIMVDDLYVRFNHQSCAAALKQEISAENLLLGVVIDVNNKPNSIISLVADNLELCTETETVLEGNSFGDKNSTFGLTAEIKRPTKALKDIKLAIQLINGLFDEFKMSTYTRFWQSINVTDEPILGYVAPKIVTELHISIINTALSLVREGARPALLAIDELYLTSMVMEKTSQVMIRLIADEVALYLKRNKQGLENMKNYICLIDSGLIDLNVKFSEDGRLEFGVINNVITVRACQDSLSALCKLVDVMIKNSSAQQQQQQQQHNSNGGASAKPEITQTIPFETDEEEAEEMDGKQHEAYSSPADGVKASASSGAVANQETASSSGQLNSDSRRSLLEREMNLLSDAMNDFKAGDKEDNRSLPNNARHQKSSVNQQQHKDATASCERDQHDDRDSYITDSSSENENEDDDDDDDDDDDEDSRTGSGGRDPRNVCILDQSNPSIGDSLSPPLLPAPFGQPANTDGEDEGDLIEQLSSSAIAAGKAIDESGFFVIGDDDVGAGIMDRQQSEPVVRRLTQKPITIVENHFKMTKPRTVPDMLAASLERYVLEEMTLVVNLYGGRDFDDETSNDTHETGSSTATTNTASEDQLAAEAELLDTMSIDSGSIRSRASSIASVKKLSSMGNKTSSTDSAASGIVGSSGSLKRRPGAGGRRKHLSESARDHYKPRESSVIAEPRVRFGEGAVNLWESLDLMSSPDFLGTNKRAQQQALSSDSKLAGGTWRRNDVCIQLTLNKVKLLYEIAEESSPISWRFMLFVHDIEIKDKIHASDINKLLYEYCTESMPRRNTQILTIKNVATINPSDGCEECDLRVSLKPLRLNIDQDTLLFLTEFLTSFIKSLGKQKLAPSGSSTSSATATATTTTTTTTTTSSPTSTNAATRQTEVASGGVSSFDKTSSSSSLSSPKFKAAAAVTPADGAKVGGAKKTIAHGGERQQQQQRQSQTITVDRRSGHDDGDEIGQNSEEEEDDDDEYHETEGLPTHCHRDGSGSANQQHSIYIKSFTFSPDVPIRLDYHAKHLDFEQGALAGILMGLAHLDHSELVLRRVHAKHGMRGLDRVLLFTLNSWLNDIKRNQLPSILSGVGPMHSVIQLFQGMRDLIWMPIDHYRKDRRLVRGLQRGASSFSSSTAMAAINLVNRFISIVQCTAQIAHDIVTPPSLHAATSSSSSAAAAAMLSDCSTAGGGSLSSSHNPSSGGGGNRRRAKLSSSRTGGGAVSTHHRFATSLGAGSSGGSSSVATLNQPRNFCEGVAVGFTILKEGFNDTARNVAVGMQAEDMRSAVGELVRQIPSTLLNPIISATEGAQNVLVGIRNQIAPDARRDDQEKWKRRVRGK